MWQSIAKVLVKAAVWAANNPDKIVEIVEAVTKANDKPKVS